jgi:hypothetical protein
VEVGVAGPLGRLVPPDTIHLQKYPLTALPKAEQPRGVPVVLGVDWHQNFDQPVKDGNRWWIGRGPLGPLRGGHAICVLSEAQKDQWGWYAFYDQNAGSCVGFSGSRMISLLNRRRYEAYWLWDRAKEHDVWSDSNPGDDGGTSVRAMADVLRELGHVRVKRGSPLSEWADAYNRTGLVADGAEGISANRWALTVDEVLSVLASPTYEQIGAVPLVNSWGPGYPHKVWLPLETLHTLLDRDGEATMVTDR